MAFGIRCQSHGLAPVAFHCPHLKVDATFYHVCEVPDVGMCGVCYIQYGRKVKSIPEENLIPVCGGCFIRLKDKCNPVFNRLVETINEHS
jgi:hypothetical protein